VLNVTLYFFPMRC